MEEFMGSLCKAAALAAIVVLSAGCFAGGATGVARFNVTPHDYLVSGVTTTPENMVYAAGRVNVDRYNAETYRGAVERGQAYPYAGGAYGNDYNVFYGGPSGWVSPVVAPPQGYQRYGGYPASHDEVEEAFLRANEALEVGRIVVDQHRQPRPAGQGGGR
ncbi:hypothetical protein COY93_03670 [Candidatus Uhrbacteria bacterium CG_4_10_14_0_8_um_filter_58_22]|uniref:Uncharacterized protein n=1 Tax=Candidatus Uhrbacteria bacterium CG_4_10_14_0_8_um_filter_58_22 TaxID=1975029 RepID=A0A2M7QA50_9BACT|nr:MAG: hypothetical protein AUJ19_02645 [Parcubacteria group bacterium CG1_02_58_44]PIY62188.1 MAG: hypothetical protein COY93_03670 [Candidatus Uhrbacteria bacterium CG_4_10_14_0_8_um_filter_58_22]